MPPLLVSACMHACMHMRHGHLTNIFGSGVPLEEPSGHQPSSISCASFCVMSNFNRSCTVSLTHALMPSGVFWKTMHKGQQGQNRQWVTAQQVICGQGVFRFDAIKVACFLPLPVLALLAPVAFAHNGPKNISCEAGKSDFMASAFST